MSIFKKFNPQDVSISSFDTHKSWEITPSNSASKGVGIFTSYYSSASSDNFSTTDPNNTRKWFQLDKLYYRNYPVSPDLYKNVEISTINRLGDWDELNTPGVIRGANSLFGNPDYDTTERKIYDRLNIISVPSKMYGRKIKPKTFSISGSFSNGALSKIIGDDGKENLFDTKWNSYTFIDNANRALYIDVHRNFRKYASSSVTDTQLTDGSLRYNEYGVNKVTYSSGLLGTKIDFNSSNSSSIEVYHNNNFNFNKDTDFAITSYITSDSNNGSRFSLSFAKSSSVSSESPTPSDVTFKSDGSKMFVGDFQNDEIYEYTLSTPWDVTTKSFITSASFSGSIERNIYLKPDGTRLYSNNFSSTTSSLYEYTLSTPWDVTTLTFSQSKDLSQYGSFERGLFIKPDGTKLYTVTGITKKINEYNLSTPYSISTLSFNQSASLSTTPLEVGFSSNGEKIYILNSDDTISKGYLSTPYDISTIGVIETSNTLNPYSTGPTGLFLKPEIDPSSIFVADIINDSIIEYSTLDKKQWIITKAFSEDYIPSPLDTELTFELKQREFIPQYPFAVYIENGFIHFERNDGQNISVISSSIDNQRHHICANKTGSMLELYKDGVKIASGSDNSEFFLQNKSNILIGTKNKKEGFYTGSLEHIMIFDKSLSSANITAISESVINSPNIGNIFYEQGFATITNPTYQDILFTSSSISHSYSINFSASHLIYENEFICNVEPDEFLFTNNITARKIPSDEVAEMADFTTGSNFRPYVTSIGLYNNEGDLLAIGKLGQPVKMPNKIDTNFIVRFDK